MSAEATGWVWKHSPYQGAQLLVHLAIADVVNDVNDNEFWMSRSNLAAKARVGRTSTSETLADMVSRGYLELIESGHAQRRPSRFRFLTPTRSATDLARPLSDLVANGQLDRSATMTRPLTGIALGRSPAANPKEITQEPKADFSCVRCQGRGVIYSATAGTDVRCPCVDARPLVSTEGARP